jgi:hypothetical protein
MGKAARLRRERGSGIRHSRPPLSITFVDCDYDRGSRAHGRGARPSPPEGRVIGRSGLVHANWDGTLLRVTGTELIDGPRPASALIRALEGRQLVVGHGLLTADLRSARMITDVPASLLARAVDTLIVAWRIRGKRYPTGCGLTALAAANTDGRRSKPTYRSSAPGLREGSDPSPRRGDNDPRDDALLVAELWKSLVTTRFLFWGAGAPSWTTSEGDTRPGSPGGTAALATADADVLTGRRPQLGDDERPTWYLPYAALDGHDALRLAEMPAGDLPAPALIREVAESIAPRRAPLVNEDLWTACQYLGTRQNAELRERIAAGRRLTKVLREPLERAIRQSAELRAMGLM